MNKKGFGALGIILVLAAAVAFTSVWYYWQYEQGQPNANDNGIASTLAPSVPAGVASTTWKTYVNHKYGFSLSYPSYLANSGALQEDSSGQACAKDYAYDGTSINDTQVASVGDLSIVVACEKLTSAYINQFNNGVYGTGLNQMATTTVAGKTAYEDSFTTATDYTWSVLQVPIDSSHYLELDYTYKPSSSQQLSDRDWAAIVASVKF